MMANPGDGLGGERSAPATGETLGIEGLRNGGIGPAHRQGCNGLEDLRRGPDPLGGPQPCHRQIGRGRGMPQEVDARLPLRGLDGRQGDLFDQQASECLAFRLGGRRRTPHGWEIGREP
jgi:hypothetical protein